MARLEDLTPGARVTGVVTGQAVTVVAVQWHGTAALTLTFRDDAGRPGEQLLYRDSESQLAVEASGKAWSLTADGALFRLVSEARRIQLAYLFDPMLAVSNSNVMPLPHQISAVYEEMLTRQPLHFLLADDPGAGKTIMAGLLIKELMVRGDAKRVLIVCPGMLVDQWQDELREKFHLGFEIVTRQMIDASYAGNPFLEKDLLIARLDHLSRNEELLAKLGAERVGPRDLRRGPQDVGALLRQRGQGDQALQARHAPRRGDAPSAADDGDAALRQARGLRPLHGAARLRPLRTARCAARRARARRPAPAT